MFKPGDLVKFKSSSYWGQDPNAYAFFTDAEGETVRLQVKFAIGCVCEVLQNFSFTLKIFIPSHNLTGMFSDYDFEPFNS